MGVLGASGSGHQGPRRGSVCQVPRPMIPDTQAEGRRPPTAPLVLGEPPAQPSLHSRRCGGRPHEGAPCVSSDELKLVPRAGPGVPGHGGARVLGAHSRLPPPRLGALVPLPGPALFAPKRDAPLLRTPAAQGRASLCPLAAPVRDAGRLSAAPGARAQSRAHGCGRGGAREARAKEPAAAEGAPRSTSWRWPRPRLLLFSTWSAMEK
jgi:hypothetical protein